jgi:hypothetical protein
VLIGKHYSIFCECCTKTEQLFSQTMKDCEQEARGMGWTIKKGKWVCGDCK